MKKLVSFLLAAVMLLSLSACGEKSAKDAVSSSKSAAVSSIAKADTIEKLNELVAKDVSDTVEALNTEFEKLSAEVDTYDKFKSGTGKVESFYDKVRSDTQLLCIRLREYSAAYADLILASDKDFDEKNDDFDELYDSVYDDARDDVYDGIYDDIFDDMYDLFYDGIIDDAYDSVPYKEWSNIRSDEYKRWSGARSDVYEIWSDAGSDIYEFWSDIRGEMWDKDAERAKKKVADFKEDIEALYTKQSEKPTDTAGKDKAKTTASADDKQWKEFLSDYEDFIDDYVAVLKKYSKNPSDFTILADYTEMVEELSEWQTQADELAEELENASPTEAAEYSAEILKITAKIAEVAE